jgi:methylmalonyl-CoA/ethylmalonyl-CoA epimerase
MNIEKIDHIGIAVKDLTSAVKLYTDVFKLEPKKIEEFRDLDVKVAFIPVGEVMVELVQPMSNDAPLMQRIKEHGEGLYHLAWRVNNIDEALEEMKEMGIEMRDNEPRPGGMGSRIALSKPNSTNNVIIELVERAREI